MSVILRIPLSVLSERLGFADGIKVVHVKDMGLYEIATETVCLVLGGPAAKVDMNHGVSPEGLPYSEDVQEFLPGRLIKSAEWLKANQDSCTDKSKLRFISPRSGIRKP